VKRYYLELKGSLVKWESSIGFGALYSGIFVLFALPALLSVLDKPIQLLTYRKKEDEKHARKGIVSLVLLFIIVSFSWMCK